MIFKCLGTCQESSLMKVSSGSLPKEAGLLAEDLNLIYCFAGVGGFKMSCNLSRIFFNESK